MKITKQIDFSDVESLSRLLKAGRVSTERFSLDIPLEDAVNSVYSAVVSVVELRGGKFLDGSHAHQQIFEVARWLTDPNGKTGLYLCGLYGNGKTTMAKALALLISRLTEIENGYRERKVMRFITAKEICRIFVADMKEYRGLFDEEMLIIDDLGTEPREILQYGNPCTPVIDLIYERYDKRLMTVVTSNLQGDDIEKTYSAKMRDRFREMLQSVVFKNESYR